MCINPRSQEHTKSIKKSPWYASHRWVILCGVNNTAESRTHNISNTLCYASHCRVNLHGVHTTAESISAVSSCRDSLCSVHCASYRRVKGLKKKSMGCVSHPPLCQPPGGHHSAESISAVCITPQRQTAHCRLRIKILSLVACNGTIMKNQFTGEHTVSIMHTEESKFSN